ncbi:segregation and condensation protein A [Reinekea blandensis]|uniref:Segregation and condensation protein A n=1 Tax=Reinekea blandensis MED297 TaxID=314283 RepID=A4BCE6_9GAMM|nr:ScpA family protein [Reinekea blandensis]EAR10212.1 chromosome segregation and condensation protein ScpA [Reinekea sp. MED297] [Reinekea blandensis MED297]
MIDENDSPLSAESETGSTPSDSTGDVTERDQPTATEASTAAEDAHAPETEATSDEAQDDAAAEPAPEALFTEQDAPLPDQPLTPKQRALQALRARAQAEQTEMPFAVVEGEAMTQIPIDLYIPPDAMEVFLDAFEGPLDLLLYLIRKQNLDILNINVFEITNQYMEYIELMQGMQLELASEYLVMASMLAEIKSRMLLPRTKQDDDEEEEDPRAELIRRLQEYEQFKEAAENLDTIPRVGRDIFLAEETRPDFERPKLHPDVDMREILLAFKEVMSRAEMFEGHEVQKESLSTRQRMGEVLDRLQGQAFVPFVALFDPSEGRTGVLVTFLAILELSKESLIDLVQSEVFAPIHVKAKTD